VPPSSFLNRSIASRSFTSDCISGHSHDSGCAYRQTMQGSWRISCSCGCCCGGCCCGCGRVFDWGWGGE
jgi:hypothetical protein